MALRSIAGLYCVTDSLRLPACLMVNTGLAASGHPLYGGVRLADGTLAGSTLTMDDALRNLINALGLSLAGIATDVHARG